MDAGCLVAIVDDDNSVRRALRRLIRSLYFVPLDYESGRAFLDSLGEKTPACVLLDLHMPETDGLEVLRQLKARNISIPVIMITGNAQPSTQDRCMAAGAVAYLQKPLEGDVVLSTIDAALRFRSHKG
jgi:FixJ family two-component response regulator